MHVPKPTEGYSSMGSVAEQRRGGSKGCSSGGMGRPGCLVRYGEAQNKVRDESVPLVGLTGLEWFQRENGFRRKKRFGGYDNVFILRQVSWKY